MSTRLTWKKGPYNAYAGEAGGIRLFNITWKSRREDPNWLMRCDLPGVHGEWKSDDKDELQADAERVLATWLERVNGGLANEQPGGAERR